MEFNQRGQPKHLFFGHGATQDTFEKRDFSTTNNMVYEQRQKIETIINPNTFECDKGKSLSKMQINSNQQDLPVMFGKSGGFSGQSMAKPYGQYTGKFDNNSLKIGLRQ